MLQKRMILVRNLETRTVHIQSNAKERLASMSLPRPGLPEDTLPAAPIASAQPFRPSGSSDHQTVTAPAAPLRFESETASLLAKGCFSRINQAIYTDGKNSQAAQNAFSKSVQQALNDAQDAGIHNPVIMGALPFDLIQKSDLYIPQSCAKTKRTPSAKQAPAGATALTVRRLHTRSVPDHDGYTSAVHRAATLIQEGALQKVVLARQLSMEFDTTIDVEAIFQRLVTLNPSVTHFQVPLANGGVLLGASPELLLRREGRRVTCNPLAGSARRVSNPQEDALIGSALLVSAKDRHEHSFVVSQLQAALTPLCDTLYVPSEPNLIQTAQMWHLSTHIEGYLTDAQLSALDLAIRVHPTPAVCGTPTDTARDLISELEPFNRGTFAGAVGWCDHNGDGEWAVTIRCGVVQDRTVHLYAGAGIVADSNPEMEWAETEAKLGTMLNVFGLAEHCA